ncbi:MAG: glycine--tRNA ligase subunit beta [Fusobacteriaceae bacterium]
MRLLFEIGMEELPARFLLPTLAELKNILEKKFNENRIKITNIKTDGTPRRLVVTIEGIAEIQENLNLLNMGPAKNVAFGADGEISRAGLGFLKSQGADPSNFEMVETPKGEYIAVRKFVEGRPTTEMISDMLKESVLEITFPRSMKWSDKKMRFARPIQWFLAILDDTVVDFEIEGIKSGRNSRGHRFFGENFTANTIDEYFIKLRENNVIVNIEERKNLIKKLIEEKCTTEGEYAHIEPELLEEVTNLVEYPYPIVGTFNSEFLEVPQEVLIITMQVHQRYFPILNRDGKLQSKFVVVRNGIEDSEHVRKGNEKVLSARLADARFFYNEDLKNPLINNIEKLKTVVYQKDLGTIYNKIERSKEIALELIKALNLSDRKDDILRTVELSKADLVSNMIGEKEFTKLQGFMGEEYALKFGEKSSVALGIKEHYYPRFTGDVCPTAAEGIVTALADRFDTLVGCFAVGLVPTGSKDPFALRRAALGIVNIILNSNLEFSISDIVKTTLEILDEKKLLKKDIETIYNDLMEFFVQRVSNLFQDLGYRKDIIAAVLDSNNESVMEARKKVEALQKLSEHSDFEKFITVLKRVGNIAKESQALNIDETLFIVPVEREIFKFTTEFESSIEAMLGEKKFETYLESIVASVTLVDRYFSEVMIMDKDEAVKNNRLAQVGILDQLFNKVANIKLVENI